ncbi:MAG: hypothetical protein AB1472_00025 [Candidatus Omnitrophota bacterium]
MEEIIDKLLGSRLKKTQFLFLPEEKSNLDYEKAQDEFIDYYSRVGGVCSIYKYGKVSVCGLSDMDFIVVLDDNYRHRYGVRYDINYFSPLTQYLLIHPQLFISKSLMKNIVFFVDTSNLQKIWGEEIIFEQPTEQELKAIAILLQIDGFILSLPKLVLKPLLEEKINLRAMIANINRIKYAIGRLERITNKKNEIYSIFVEDFSLFRNSWLRNSKDENLKLLIIYLKKAIKIIYSLIKDFSEALDKENYYSSVFKNPSRLNIGFKVAEDVTYFEKDWDASGSFNSTINLFFQSRRYMQFLPLNFSYHLFQYTKINNKFANYIKERLFLNQDLDIKSNNQLEIKKAELINKHIEFLENGRIDGNAIFCHLGYRSNIKRFPGEYRYSNYKRWIERRLNFIKS